MVVVAIGCRWMKDDAIGVLVAERIQKNLHNHGIDVVIAETDFEFGRNSLCNGDHVIILDAICSDKIPGEITVLPLQNIEVTGIRPFTQHECNLIDLFERPFGIRGCLIGIEAAEIGYGFELSEQLSLSFNEVCDNVERIILNERGITC